MIFKVFYQERKDRNPRREQTQSLYLDIDTNNERDGIIAVRELIESKTDYNIEFIEALTEKHLAYEKESGAFALTEL